MVCLLGLLFAANMSKKPFAYDYHVFIYVCESRFYCSMSNGGGGNACGVACK